jgi:hypothetical protein
VELFVSTYDGVRSVRMEDRSFCEKSLVRPMMGSEYTVPIPCRFGSTYARVRIVIACPQPQDCAVVWFDL